MSDVYSITIPSNIKPKPSEKEIDAAYILSGYFKKNIKFIPRQNGKTPDLLIGNIA
jgi:hypothetical protein